MNISVPITLYGWIVAVVVMFSAMPPRRAVLTAYLGAALFLPMAAYNFTGLLHLDKEAAATIGAGVGVILFDSARLSTFRPRLIDLPIVLWCLIPFVSCVTAGLGVWAGTCEISTQFLRWGIPYVLARIYLADREGLRDLTAAIVIGGLLYVPLCLYEVRMSPVLHSTVYGFYQHQFAQARRAGGWRPSVFMQHGLAVAMWMTATCVTAFCLWRGRQLRGPGQVPPWAVVAALGLVAVLCKSIGALQLLALGTTVAWLVFQFRTPTPLLCLAVIAPLYMAGRIGGLLHADSISSVQEGVVDRDRYDSLEFRLRNEDQIIERAKARIAFGYGWEDFMKEDGQIDTVPDGYWVLVLGRNGLAGLAALTATLLAPVFALIASWPRRLWGHPAAAPVLALMVIVCLHTIDNLFNAMLNPTFALAAGALAGVAAADTVSATAMPAASPIGPPGPRRPRVRVLARPVIR